MNRILLRRFRWVTAVVVAMVALFPVVHAGDLLFKIDPRPFRADLDNRQAAEAAVEAARLRLRPILMTSFAFIFGVIPLIMATGAGAEMRQALGTVVFFGMIGVTFFGVFLTPVFYTVIRRATDRRVVATERPAGSVRTSAGGREDRPAVGGARR